VISIFTITFTENRYSNIYYKLLKLFLGGAMKHLRFFYDKIHLRKNITDNYMNKDLLLKTFRNTTGAAVYIFLVSQIMQNGNKIFGEADTMFTPFVVLLLFSLSAAVVASLVFGQTVMLFFEAKKKESVQATIYSICWLGMYTILGILLLVSLK